YDRNGNNSQGYRELDNAAKDDNPKCWPPYCRIARRGTGGRAGRGGGRTRGQYGDQGNGRNEGQGSQVGGRGGQVGGQGSEAAKVEAKGMVGIKTAMPSMTTSRVMLGMFLENNDHRGCTYKEFLACNPKDYDGKGGAIVYTR
nr:hypothetical protein [Tanacetum cinerariifolium]